MDERECGIEDARKTLGDLAHEASADGTVTWLTSHRRRVAAIVSVAVAEAGIREAQEGL
jgi:hypothetical protein